MGGDEPGDAKMNRRGAENGKKTHRHPARQKAEENNELEAKHPKKFLAELESMKDEALGDFAEGKFGRLEFGDRQQRPQDRPEVIALLKAMVYPERIAADILAKRIPVVTDLDIKERLAEQTAEELEHLDILRRMLAEWGEDPDEMWHNPLPELVSVFEYVDTLSTLAEFFTANFIGESLLLSANLKVMRAVAPEAFATYLDVSIPDEAKHIQLNREAIMRYATTADLQERARLVARHLLNSFVAGYKAKLKFMSEMGNLRAAQPGSSHVVSPG
jgi:hypothetical protein